MSVFPHLPDDLHTLVAQYAPAESPCLSKKGRLFGKRALQQITSKMAQIPSVQLLAPEFKDSRNVRKLNERFVEVLKLTNPTLLDKIEKDYGKVVTLYGKQYPVHSPDVLYRVDRMAALAAATQKEVLACKKAKYDPDYYKVKRWLIGCLCLLVFGLLLLAVLLTTHGGAVVLVADPPTGFGMIGSLLCRASLPENNRAEEREKEMKLSAILGRDVFQLQQDAAKALLRCYLEDLKKPLDQNRSQEIFAKDFQALRDHLALVRNKLFKGKYEEAKDLLEDPALPALLEPFAKQDAFAALHTRFEKTIKKARDLLAERKALQARMELTEPLDTPQLFREAQRQVYLAPAHSELKKRMANKEIDLLPSPIRLRVQDLENHLKLGDLDHAKAEAAALEALLIP